MSVKKKDDHCYCYSCSGSSVFSQSLFLATQKSADYYTQIDNDFVTEIPPHGAMNYRYTLSAYDETGGEKELSFETSRILTDDAYLCLKVAPFRGVITWAEVQFDEMPVTVQEKYCENL